MRGAFSAIVLVLFQLAAARISLADSQSTSPAVPAGHAITYRIGVSEAPPFAMKDERGAWDGIAVRLWRHVAGDLGIQFELQELPIQDIIQGLEHAQLSAMISAVVSAERVMRVDFSHPYYAGRLGIAVPITPSNSNWVPVLRNLMSLDFLKIIGMLLIILGIAGTLVWLIERRANPDHFSRRPFKGVADGLWWAAVTMTTVGYGDKAPRTHLGRIIGGVWMFAAVVQISFFTAEVTSTLTVKNLAGRVRGPSDLAHVRVGTVRDSAVEEELRSVMGIAAVGYSGYADGLSALSNGDVDAFVASEPIVRYEVAKQFHGRLIVLPASFLREDFAFALPLNSPLRRDINESLLRYIDSEEWTKTVQAYLGHEH